MMLRMQYKMSPASAFYGAKRENMSRAEEEICIKPRLSEYVK